ncbi:hypothetical protein BDV3_000159 [Batrachochytrium dendrobatidis]|nr:Kinetochore protein Spc24 [Batrachochytrium dendrobatidis]KAK5668062.1 Kinetochore protein Spc24 [Batrachochytrium dendrobatidis]
MQVLSDDEDDANRASLNSFQINKTYAKNYSQRKQKQELAQLKEKYGNADDYGTDSEDESDDEPEDEFGELVTPQVDAQIMKTIAMIKSKNPEVYNPEVSFFSEKEMEAAKQEWNKKKQKAKLEDKPIYLKELQRKELLSNVNSEGDYEDTDDKSDVSTDDVNNHGPTHVEEQEALKNEFKKAAFNDDSDNENGQDSLFTVRPLTTEEIESENAEYSEFLLKNMGVENPDGKSWNELKETVPLDKDEAFLMNYILNRQWIDKDAERMPTFDEVVEEEDEKAVEAMEEFEHTYNFRFEEDGAAKIVYHARNIDGLLRREDNSRKLKREEHKLRKEAEKSKKMEELKRLKNLKKEELKAKLKQIRDMSGGHTIGFDEVDLDKDFDPEEFDLKMQHTFNDDYYGAEDAHIKPKFDDDIDISNFIVDSSKKSKLKKALPKSTNDDDFIMDADYLPGGDYYSSKDYIATDADNTAALDSKKNKKNKKEEKRMNLGEYLDEYYQLDYEDLIGDLPTRFKYRNVEADNYGLKPEEILEAQDTELNGVISLKKLAPYRHPEVIQKDLLKWSKLKKKRLFEFRSQLKARRSNSEYVRPNALNGVEEYQDKEDEFNKKDKAIKMKRAGIDADRLDTYMSGSIKKSKKSK